MIRVAAITLFVLFCGMRAAHATLCLATTLPSAFGVYDPSLSTPTDTTGSITITCTNLTSTGVSYTIALGPGGSGSVSGRLMNGVLGGTLGYGLYLDNNRSQVWGDTSGGGMASDAYNLTAVIPNIKTYTVYGRIPPRQVTATGAFLDSILVTVTY